MRSPYYLAVLLPLAACSGAGGWSKPGVPPGTAAQDYAECRHTAELALRRDSDIDTDILATRGQDWARLGTLQTMREQYADSNNARSGDIVERCMIGKGYTGAS
ncbi:MAG: hypothetical protein ACLQJR_08810 [Stellaceae bacterium]